MAARSSRIPSDLLEAEAALNAAITAAADAGVQLDVDVAYTDTYGRPGKPIVRVVPAERDGPGPKRSAFGG